MSDYDRTEPVSSYDRTEPKLAAKDSDARAAKFLAKWSKADATKFDGFIASFNGLDLSGMHQSVVHMQANVASIAEEDPKDVARYLKDSRTQNTGYWNNHRAKDARAMFDNIKALKQYITDWERVMKP